jgi:hypothetical protein
MDNLFSLLFFPVLVVVMGICCLTYALIVTHGDKKQTHPSA